MDKKEGKTVCKPIVSREQPCIDSSLELRSYKLTSLSLKVSKTMQYCSGSTRVTPLPKHLRLRKVIVFLWLQMVFQHKRSLHGVEHQIDRNCEPRSVFLCFFLVPGRPALGANKQLNPIDCSNAASAPSATRRRGREKQHSTPESKQVILNDPQSQSRVDVGASSKRCAPFLFSLVGDGDVRRVSGRISPVSARPNALVPGGPSPPALFETRSLTHSRSTPFKYFKRVGCSAIT